MTDEGKTEALASEWSERITEAYFRTVVPTPSMSDLVELRASIFRDIEMQALTGVATEAWADRINRTIETWEAFTGLQGERIETLDVSTGEFMMAAA